MTEGAPKSADANQPRGIFIKEGFFSQIESGEKTLELRIGFSSFTRIKAGDVLKFQISTNKSVQVKVSAVRKYQNLRDVEEKEDMNKLAPRIPREQTMKISRRVFKEEDIQKYGLVIIEFQKL